MKKILFAVAGTILIGLGGAGYYATTLTSEDTILSNIYIADINVGDLTKEEALKALKSDDIKTGINVTLKYGEKQFNVDTSEFGYGYDIEGTVEKAYNTGKSDSFVTNMMTTLSQEFLGAQENLEPPLKLIEDKYDEAIDKVAIELETPVVEPSIKVESGEIIINEGSNGIVIDRILLKANIKEQLEAKELFRADQNTNYNVEIPVKVEEQSIKSDSLKKITGIIGEYTTKYNGGNAGRNNNIALAAKSINDKIINPGESFSYNKAIGEITYANGYMDDTVIVNGRIEQGVGGGVCQVSSTLYNAALYSNMDIIERRNHSVRSDYTPISRDAVISYGVIDLVIKNPYDYPLIIKSGTYNGTITVQIYGNVETAPEVVLSSEVIGTKARGVVYIDDPNMAVGTEKVRYAGRDQIQGRLYKSVNGVTTTVSTDTYPAKNKEILRGTKNVEEPKNSETPKSVETPSSVETDNNVATDTEVDALIGE